MHCVERSFGSERGGPVLAHRFQGSSLRKNTTRYRAKHQQKHKHGRCSSPEALTIFTPFISLKNTQLGGFLNRYIKKYSFPCNLYRLIRVGDSWDSRGDGFIDDAMSSSKMPCPYELSDHTSLQWDASIPVTSFGSPSYSG